MREVVVRGVSFPGPRCGAVLALLCLLVARAGAATIESAGSAAKTALASGAVPAEEVAHLDAESGEEDPNDPTYPTARCLKK